MEDPLLSFNSIDEVIEGKLFIGDLGTARGIHRGRNPQNITHVLTVCPDYISDGSHDNHMTIDVDDSELSDLLIDLPKACDFIEDAISGGGRVLVHCVMGISRSATTVCAYLMRKQRLSSYKALERVRQSRPQACPNAGFMKQLVIFERCKYAPTKDDPAYREFKEQLKADAIRFINDFIDVYPFVGEKIFVCSDLPYNTQHIALLMDSYGISHLLTIRPAESTARNIVNAKCLHIHMDDDFEKDDLVLYMDSMLQHIKSGVIGPDGTGILIHSFTESHIRLPLAAYLMDVKNISSDTAIELTLKVKEIPEEDIDEMREFVEPRLRLYESCHFSIKDNDPLVQEFMKHGRQLE